MEPKNTTNLTLEPLTHEGIVRLVSVEVVDRVAENAEVIKDSPCAARLLSLLIGDKDREHFVVLHLDNKHRVIAAEVAGIGTLNQALVHPREVFKAAILNNAQAIICGHNHPSGDLTPSPEDHAIESRLRNAGDIIGIRLLDFVIVSGVRYWARQEAR